MKGGPLETLKKNFEKKSLNAEKKLKEKPFRFSSLDRMIQFRTIKFHGNFQNYFGQFVWIEKKVIIIVAFHFMKRRLKTMLQHVHSKTHPKQYIAKPQIYCFYKRHVCIMHDLSNVVFHEADYIILSKRLS